MNKIFTSIIGLILIANLQAQETVISTGGEASSPNDGFVSYTIGQVVYSSNTGTGGNYIIEGVQQPIVSVISQIEEAKDINLSISAFPNPATEFIILRVENYKAENLQYRVYDLTGKLIKTVNATGAETKIEIGSFIEANYFVKVLDREKEIKTFKIVKK